MKTLLLLLICIPAFALSNAVTIRNLSGSAQTNRTWAIHRYFADKEICGQPQPFAGGSAITYWQGDVTSRWPADGDCAGGYAKTAMISFEATVGQSPAALVVEFRASTNGCNLGSVATCTAAGMSGAEMLAFDAGGGVSSWGLKVVASVGGQPNQTASARTMIAAGQYQVLKNGPLFTEVLVREGPQSVQGTSTRNTSFGWRGLKTSNNAVSCSAPYASDCTWTDTAAWHSIRPTFLVRFYRRWGRVEGDSVLHNAWMDRHVDQRLDSYAVLHGASESTSCYTAPAAFVIPARSTVWDGPCWSTDPVDYTNTKFDLNTAYLIYSKAVPEYDPSFAPSASVIDAEMNFNDSGNTITSGWNFTDKGATTTATISPHMGIGQWNMSPGGGGAMHYVSPIARGQARYLLSMNNDLREVVMGGAKAFMHIPIASISPSTGTYWTGHAKTAYGRPMSLLAHPTYSWLNYTANLADSLRDPGGTLVSNGCAACMVSCTNRSSADLMACSNYSGSASNGWGYENAHVPSALFIPWLITGKHFITEALWHQSMWAAAYHQGPATLNNPQGERVGSVGYMLDDSNLVRAMAWTLRNKATAVVATPDSFDAEKAYFTQMVTGALAIDEGRLGILNGSYPPPSPASPGTNYGCGNPLPGSWSATANKWCIGKHFFDAGRSNPLWFPQGKAGAAPGGYSVCTGCDYSKTLGQSKPWMAQYLTAAYAMLTDWGFPARVLHEKVSQNTMGMFFDSGGVNGPSAVGYGVPMRSMTDGYLQTWAAHADARLFTARLMRAISDSATEMYVASSHLGTSIGSDKYNTWDVAQASKLPVKVGSEIVWVNTIGSADYLVSAVNTGTGVVTVGTHPYETGDLARVGNLLSGVIPTPLDISDGGSMCVHGKYDCDFYVEKINATTIKLYLDAARTQPVVWTAYPPTSGHTYVSYTSLSVSACSTPSCRGIMGTTATSHAIGETVSIKTNSVLSGGYIGVDGPHGSTYYGGLATAAERGVNYTDSVTGKIITGERAFETYRRWFYGIQLFGGSIVCSQSAISSCGNPMWGYKPRGTPTNVRLVGNSLLYNAPDGGACRYAVSTTPLASTDDSGDTASITGPRARSISLTSGTQYYRISCGLTGRVKGQVTVP